MKPIIKPSVPDGSLGTLFFLPPDMLVKLQCVPFNWSIRYTSSGNVWFSTQYVSEKDHWYS